MHTSLRMETMKTKKGLARQKHIFIILPSYILLNNLSHFPEALLDHHHVHSVRKSFAYISIHLIFCEISTQTRKINFK